MTKGGGTALTWELLKGTRDEVRSTRDEGLFRLVNRADAEGLRK